MYKRLEKSLIFIKFLRCTTETLHKAHMTCLCNSGEPTRTNHDEKSFELKKRTGGGGGGGGGVNKKQGMEGLHESGD